MTQNPAPAEDTGKTPPQVGVVNALHSHHAMWAGVLIGGAAAFASYAGTLPAHAWYTPAIVAIGIGLAATGRSWLYG